MRDYYNVDAYRGPQKSGYYPEERKPVSKSRESAVIVPEEGSSIRFPFERTLHQPSPAERHQSYQASFATCHHDVAVPNNSKPTVTQVSANNTLAVTNASDHQSSANDQGKGDVQREVSVRDTV